MKYCLKENSKHCLLVMHFRKHALRYIPVALVCDRMLKPFDSSLQWVVMRAGCAGYLLCD